MDERTRLALAAQMEGESTVLRSLGCKHKVSEMELVTLCNLAYLSCLSVFASAADDDLSHKTAAERDRLVAAIRKCFGRDENDDGLERLVQACLAILGQDRLGRYLVSMDR